VLKSAIWIISKVPSKYQLFNTYDFSDSASYKFQRIAAKKKYAHCQIMDLPLLQIQLHPSPKQQANTSQNKNIQLNIRKKSWMSFNNSLAISLTI